MSEDNKNIEMKSCSESDVFNESMSYNNVKQTESDKPKLRRTFTLPRNPFGSVRVSNRRPKTSENQQSPPSDESIETSETENEKPGIKIFRRPSWRKFINKIAQRMNAVGVPGVKLPQSDSRVPPVGGFPWPPDQTPGVTGLRNHGNTCFMNAVLQCLSHTDILAEYFVLDQYKVDLSRRNKLNSRKFGTRGELTEQLALVLKALWACRDSPELGTGFKAVVERHGSQFRGSAQHDAQEFLNWLLERVHEDLNTATKRRYKSIKNTLGRPDEVVAAETLANYVRCHSSFVQAVFQAQFRSSLTCPRCLKQSNTFDPFHCIAVQLPQVSVQNVIITVLYSSQQPRQMRLGLTVSPETNIGTLRELLQSDTGIPAHRIVLTEIGEQGFTRTFCDSQPMAVLCEGDPIFCIEAPPLECSGDESSAEKRQAEDGELKNVPTIDGGPYLLLCWVNVLVKENAEIEKFGSPYAMQVPRDTGYGDLQKLILKDMAPMLHDNVLEGAQPFGVFRARLAEPLADPDGSQYVDTDVEHPLFTETFDTCLTLYPPDAGPPHIKLILEWGAKEYEELIQHSKDVIEDHSSVSQLQSKPLHCAPLTLEQCLEHYTKAETLADDNAWRCPHCQQYLPAVKTLGLWSLPDILVIHFVRFRQQQLKGPKSSKLTTMVDFPLQGFDMTPHLSRPCPPSDDVSLKAPVAPLLGGVGWSPWKRPRKSNQCNDNLYDLYAVCYHQGDDLETGHYTAACKNPFDSLWYKFDDTKVTMIDNDVQGALVNNGAYILFYQKQQGGSGGSSAASSTSGDHWAARMAPFPKPSSEITVTTKPHTVAPTTTVTKSESFVEEREPYSETNIRNSMSLSDNLMVDIGIDTDSKENINERENNKNVKINEVITDLMKSKIDVNEYRRNTFDGTMNKDIHINPKMRSTTNLNRSSLTSIKSDSKINLITNVKVADLLLKSKTVADKNTSHVECPEKIVENCVSVSRVRKVDVQTGHVSQAGTNVTKALGRYATLGPEQTMRNTMDYRDHHSDDEALPARNDWMSPLSMRRAVVPP